MIVVIQRDCISGFQIGIGGISLGIQETIGEDQLSISRIGDECVISDDQTELNITRVGLGNGVVEEELRELSCLFNIRATNVEVIVGVVRVEVRQLPLEGFQVNGTSSHNLVAIIIVVIGNHLRNLIQSDGEAGGEVVH